MRLAECWYLQHTLVSGWFFERIQRKRKGGCKRHGAFGLHAGIGACVCGEQHDSKLSGRGIYSSPDVRTVCTFSTGCLREPGDAFPGDPER